MTPLSSTAPPKFKSPVVPTARLTPTLRPAKLVVQREDIRFGNLRPGVVWLEVEVHNCGERASQEAPMEVRVAPFGAFVASRPLEVLVVPSIPPGSSTVVRTTFQEDWDGELAPVDAVDRSTGVAAANRHRALAREHARKGASEGAGERHSAVESTLAALRQRVLDSVVGIRSVTDMLRRLVRAPAGQSICWAGNFDVHIGSAEAERHVMRAVRLEAGELNIAMFVVGERAEDFVFDLQGGAASWQASLVMGLQELPLGRPQALLPRSMVFLKVTPPAGTTEGLLAVGVTRQATGKRALVEFGFGLDTIPPGCFCD